MVLTWDNVVYVVTRCWSGRKVGRHCVYTSTPLPASTKNIQDMYGGIEGRKARKKPATDTRAREASLSGDVGGKCMP